MHALDHDSPACAIESKYLQTVLTALGYHLMVLHFGLTRFARTLLRIGRNAILALQNQLRCWGFSSARECYSSLSDPPKSPPACSRFVMELVEPGMIWSQQPAVLMQVS